MKRVLLVSFGLLLVGGYVACAPGDSGTTDHPTGTAGTGGGSGPGVAGTTGNAGDSGQGQAGTSGNAGDSGQGQAGDTGQGQAGTGGSTGPGEAGRGGSSQAGTGGSGQGQAGTGGSGPGQAGRGGTTGQAGRGGTNGTAGTGGSTAGTTGQAGRGGTNGTAGTGGSTAGTTGSAGKGGTTGSGGTAGNPAGVLDGVMFTGPCLRDTEASVCATVNGTCPNTNASDIPLRGVLTTDKTVTMGGDPNTTYTAVFHVQGEVESKNYNGGTDQNTSLTSPKADGWRNGGTPNTGNAYNVYMLRVTDTPGATARDYFLNSLDPPGVENHTTYGIDYMTPASGNLAFTFKGGASVRIVAADSNCSMIKNCGPTVNGSTCMAPIILQNIEPTAVSKNPSFDFTKAYNGQWIVLTVKSVTP